MSFRLFRSFSSSLDPLKAIVEKTKSIRGIFRPPAFQDAEAPSNMLVVLVGWTMAKQKHIAKYADIYSNLGLPTLSLNPTLLHTLSITSYDKYSRKVTELLNSSYKGSVIFHFFSSSATIILPSLTRTADKLGNIQLKGIVFDCGPIMYVRESGMAAAKLLLDQGRMNRLTYYTSIAFGMLMENIDGNKIRHEMAEAFRRPALSSIPQLYLYSDEDTVVPLKRIQKIMEEQKQLGRDIKGVLFKGAHHIRLLQADPVKYANQLSAFCRGNITARQ